MIAHTADSQLHIDMDSDFELHPDELPRGQTPIWIQPPEGTSQIEMIERVLKIPELKHYSNNVTVLYNEKDDKVMDMCRNTGYKYIFYGNFTGAEDKVIIIFNAGLSTEVITRAINMLVIVSNYR